MKRFFGALLSGLILWAMPLAAQDNAKPDRIILVELFTSQGCYSCPPADKILEAMTHEPDLLPLSLHVDSWDQLGWKDIFALPQFSERQMSYNAQIIKRSRRVTPQMIFNGIAEVAGGGKRSKAIINKTLKILRSRDEFADVEITRNGNNVSLTLSTPHNGLGEADISLVRFSPSETVKIDRGENAGKRITYHNVVHAFDVVARWNTAKNAEVKFELPNSDDEFAVIVQGKRFGPVYVARRLPAGADS